MREPAETSGHPVEKDAEVLAVKNLIAEDRRAPAPRHDRPAPARARASAGSQRGKTRMPVAGKRSAKTSRVGEIARSLSAAALERLRSYRPERKSVLLTSLVLLILLKPFMMIGWTLFACFLVLLCYLFTGPDRFWRGVIAHHRRFARRRPDTARKIKLRAYKLARKWDRWLEYAPEGLADVLRSPDLRGIIAADARHDIALHNRLSQLQKDAVRG